MISYYGSFLLGILMSRNLCCWPVKNHIPHCGVNMIKSDWPKSNGRIQELQNFFNQRQSP
jgi:hypothetical protein